MINFKKNLNNEKVIDVEAIENMITEFSSRKPPFAVLQFKYNNVDKQLSIVVTFYYDKRNVIRFKTPASQELIQVAIDFMQSDSTENLMNYLNSGNLGEVITKDDRSYLFKDFLTNDCNGEKKPNWINGNGQEFICFDFSLNRNLKVSFCLPKNVRLLSALKKAGLPYDVKTLTLTSQSKEEPQNA